MTFYFHGPSESSRLQSTSEQNCSLDLSIGVIKDASINFTIRGSGIALVQPNSKLKKK